MSPARPWPKVAVASFGIISFTKLPSIIASNSTCALASFLPAASIGSVRAERAFARPPIADALAGGGPPALPRSRGESVEALRRHRGARRIGRLGHFKDDVRGRIECHVTAVE